jgi:hypothetical protein
LLAEGKASQPEPELAASAKALAGEAEAAAPNTLNNLAWLLATSDLSAVRDGHRALDLAEKAVASAARKDPMYLDTLAAAYAELGEFGNATKVQNEAIGLLQRAPQGIDRAIRTANGTQKAEKEDCVRRLKRYETSRPWRTSDGPAYAGTVAAYTARLLQEGRFAEAESRARECLTLWERVQPDDWQVFSARIMLGLCLVSDKKYAQAEPLLLAGYKGMKEREDKVSAYGKPRSTWAAESLVQLYEATGRASQAAEWKRRLAEPERSH